MASWQSTNSSSVWISRSAKPTFRHIPQIDANDDLIVSINELILAVDSALSGCTS
jgi:hypothetical protein